MSFEVRALSIFKYSPFGRIMEEDALISCGLQQRYLRREDLSAKALTGSSTVEDCVVAGVELPAALQGFSRAHVLQVAFERCFHSEGCRVPH